MGLGNLSGALDAQFDFTDMTRSQAVKAASTLQSEGKITAQDAGVLDGFACDYAPAPGKTLPQEEQLNSPTSINFLERIQQASMADHERGLTLAASNDDALLTALNAYQMHPSDQKLPRALVGLISTPGR